MEEESRGESNLQPEGPNYNLSGKLTEYSNTYKVHCINFTCCYGAHVHDIMAAILVYQTDPVGVQLFSVVNTFFSSNKFGWLLNM